MHGIWAAIGPTASGRDLRSRIPAEVQEVQLDGIRLQRSSPPGQPLPDWQAAGPGGKVRVFVDGDLVVRGMPVARGLKAHLAAFAGHIETLGLDRAFETLVSGSFIAVVLDGTGRAVVLRDPYGSLPAYEAMAGPDWLVSSNPVTLARADGVDKAPDRLGLASWALVGYTIGTRYLVQGVSTIPAGAQRIRRQDGTVVSQPLPFHVFAHTPLVAGGPSVSEIATAFRVGCERLASADLPTAQLQSGGMDSRLILAAWPENRPITCYGYGDPGSGEVAIARAAAALRGAPYHHVHPTGDQVAGFIDDVYETNGLMVYPARWFIAERMAADGHLRVLDGFAGGFVLGGHFFSAQRKVSNLLDKVLARYRDEKIEDIGLQQIARELYPQICELPVPSSLAGYLDKSFIEELERAREQIVADIHAELVRLRPENDSVALLVQNFTVSNRSAHAILQQGVMSRHRLSVGYPYTNDYEFLKLALSIPPSRSAYRRLQIEVFRQCFPRYAALPYASSMLPVRRSAGAHQLSGILIRRGIRIPGLTGQPTRSPNSWEDWLRESRALREKLGDALQNGGIASAALPQKLDELAAGTAKGSGKLFHLASIARWLAL